MNRETYVPASDLGALADWHDTKAYKALTFPRAGYEDEMRKAAEVHVDAACRIRVLIDRLERGR